MNDLVKYQAILDGLATLSAEYKAAGNKNLARRAHDLRIDLRDSPVALVAKLHDLVVGDK
jgi:hypothetical protein